MKKEHLKIAVIGGGSSYTPELIEGFIESFDELPVRDLYLVDIEEGREKLEIIGALAKRMLEKAGVPVNVYLTFDRKSAIKDADFIITQIRVGQLDARAKDERIPMKHNLIGQETTGAGGFAKALRTIPVILEICKEIEELAPDAFLLNFTNPAGIVTEAALKYSNVKTIGLCNLPIGTKMQIADIYNVDPSQIDIEVVGINHLIWTTKILVNSIDVTKDILNKAASSKGLTMKNIPNFDWSKEFLLSLNALPCAYHRYFYLKEEMYNDQVQSVNTEGTRAEVVKRVEKELFELYKNPNLCDKPEQLEKRGGAYYSEAAVRLITSIYNSKKDIQTVNVQNKGVIPCLPNNVSVEVNCVIDSEGATPVQITTPITPQIRGLLQVVKAYEELTIEAAVHGDYEKALQALVIHPLVGSLKSAKPLLDEILAANKDYLPNFH
ncbi:6-phospho-beta-glucosidase [Bacillus sp. J14TS2]|uniref:6-phospho-beta-glucosidase n=1 Tax=Bacillus sp. J14TS2 TaxID=2807188 RepID=UPI001AFEC4B6|nr:6-phospho-beta-glucosidase [Bacillus sp. J14TS2]GIN72331.1 6-phospho-beta-glucosidase [Bacillus sp. J14TS2]